MNIKKPYIIHPLLFAIFPVLFLFSYNITLVLLTGLLEIFILLVIVTSFAFLLWWLVSLVLKSKEKAGLVVSFFLLTFFSYGHLQSLAGASAIANDMYLLPICSILLGSGAYLVIKTKRSMNSLTNILFIISVSLVIISLINIASYEINSAVAYQTNINTESITINATTQETYKPDIYYIIFDRYGDSSTLKTVYNFDNSEFLDYLGSNGFYVAAESRSNYHKTAASLASSLSMEYINYLSDKLGESNDEGTLYRMMKDCKVCQFLKSKGYKYIHFGSWWTPTVKNPNADINVNYFKNRLPDFSLMLYQTTMLYPITAEYIPNPNGTFGDIVGSQEAFRQEQWERTLYQFEKLAEIPSIKEPTFVFAHMLVPHTPIVFDQDGNYLTEKEARKMTVEEGYINQVIFVNKKVKELVDKILSNSKDPPIIILQADEGPWPRRFAIELDNFNWGQATEEEVRIKMRILNAYYLPYTDKNVLYSSITPVNSFRLVFNFYFNTNLELLPDESYVYLDEYHRYKFINVTDKVKWQ